MIVKLAKARVLGETRRRRVVRRLTQPVGALSEGQMRNRQLEFPRAVYQGVQLEAGKPDKHIWGCNTCVGTVTISSRGAHDFLKHAQSKQHDNAVKRKSLALGMQQA
jgi:hypothetical protein